MPSIIQQHCKDKNIEENSVNKLIFIISLINSKKSKKKWYPLTLKSKVTIECWIGNNPKRTRWEAAVRKLKVWIAAEE